MPTQAAVKAEIQHEDVGGKVMIIGGKKYAGKEGIKQIAHEINNS